MRLLCLFVIKYVFVVLFTDFLDLPQQGDGTRIHSAESLVVLYIIISCNYDKRIGRIYNAHFYRSLYLAPVNPNHYQIASRKSKLNQQRNQNNEVLQTHCTRSIDFEHRIWC